MKIPQTLPRMRRLAAVGTVAAAIIGLGTLVGLALPQYTVSQKGREFNPNQITIKRGETIEIVNDDGDLLHHAYIDCQGILIRFRRPAAGQQDCHYVSGGRQVRRALRHSSEDEARSSRSVAAPDYKDLVPNRAAWPT